MTFGAAMLLVGSLGSLRAQDWWAVGVAGWGGLAYSAALAIVAGYYVWTNGVKKLGASRTAVYNNLTPVTAMVTGSIFLGEAITVLQLSGAALIIFGLYTTGRAGKQSSVKAVS